MIRVVIADDHTLFRQGLRRLLELEYDIEIVAVADSGGLALSQVQKYNPDILLLDINMPGLNGIEVLDELNKLGTKTRIVVLTIYDDREYVIEILRKGAAGYLLKDVESSFLVSTIRKVAQGKKVVDNTIASTVLEEFGRLTRSGEDNDEIASLANTGPLTGREYEVLQEIAVGLCNSEIAQDLFISEKTVKNHISSIYRKLDVKDRTAAVIKAVKLGLVEIK